MSDYQADYWAWVRREARAVQSDGCTAVSELFHDCCLEHDLAYRYGRNPREAYYDYRAYRPGYWSRAGRMTRAEADRRFRRCIQSRSGFGLFSPISWIRWIGVRVGGYFTCNVWNRSRV